MASAEKVIENRKRERRELGLFLSTATGKKLLTELEKEFDPDDITEDTVEKTYINIGERNVYRLLKRLRDDAQKDE